MPPRIQTQRVSNSVLPYLSPNTSTFVSSSSSSSCTSLPSSTSCPRRTFSSTPAAQTRLRSHMFEWLNSEGRKLQYHEPNVYKYVTNLKDLGKDSMGPEQLSKRPFPLNQNFVSEPILSEEMRAEIYKRVTQDKKSVRAVSIELKVDMRRVAAVVRLMEMEKAWRSQVCLSSFLSLVSKPCLECMHCVMRQQKISISLYDLGHQGMRITTLVSDCNASIILFSLCHCYINH